MAQLFQEVEAIAIGQRNVEQDQIRATCLRDFHCLGDRAGDVDVIARFTEENAERVRHEWTVLHYKNSGGHYGRGMVSGSVKKKRLPFPSSLSTQILPSCSSTNRRA